MIEKLIEETVDCDNTKISVGDKIEVIPYLGDTFIKGLKGKIKQIKYCKKEKDVDGEDKSWIHVYVYDELGILCGENNYNVRKLKIQ